MVALGSAALDLAWLEMNTNKEQPMKKQKTKKKDVCTTTNINGVGTAKGYILTHSTKATAGHAVIPHHLTFET